jgi:hypothetical protein
MDLRHIPSVDILINNAAQTVRRLSGFYSHLMPNEELSFEELPAFAQEILSDHFTCLQELQQKHASYMARSRARNRTAC